MNRKPTTAVDRVRARLQGKIERGSMRHRADVLGYRTVEVVLDLAYGEKKRRYTKSFQVPTHKNPDANAVRTKLVNDAIAAARRENSAFGELHCSLHDYRIVR